MWDDSEKLSFVLLEGVRGTVCADDGCLLPLAGYAEFHYLCILSLTDRFCVCPGVWLYIVYNDNS